MVVLSKRTVWFAVGAVTTVVGFTASFATVYKLLKCGIGTGDMATFMTKITFYPTLMYNVLMARVSSRRWFDRIDDTVILGAIPFRSDLPLLKKAGVKHVVSLNEHFELAFSRWWTVQPSEWAALNVRHLHLKVVDLVAAPSVDQTREGVNFIKEAKERRESVYIHCKAGRTRSATLVAAYLMEEDGLSPKEAEERIKSIRSHISIRRPQKRLLDLYIEDLKTRGEGEERGE